MLFFDDLDGRIFPTPEDVASAARRRRIGLDLTQAELARRSGVPLPTLKRFEQPGNVSLEALVTIVHALGAGSGRAGLFPPAPPKTLEEVEGKKPARERRRASSRRDLG